MESGQLGKRHPHTDNHISSLKTGSQRVKMPTQEQIREQLKIQGSISRGGQSNDKAGVLGASFLKIAEAECG